jgi:hypothetical protein
MSFKGLSILSHIHYVRFEVFTMASKKILVFSYIKLCILLVKHCNGGGAASIFFFGVGGIPLCYAIQISNKYYYIQSEHNR